MSTTEQLLDEGLRRHQAGRFAEAEQFYQEVLRASPRYADALHLLGLVQHQQGRHEAAIAYIRRAVEVQPRSELYLENLSAVYHAAGRYQEAAEASRQVLRLNSNNGKAYFNLGCALDALGDFEDAAANFLRAAQINPNSAEAHLNLGNTLGKLGRLDEAARNSRRALEINPNNAEAHKSLGITLLQLGDFEAGWAHYEWRWRTQDKVFTPRNFLEPLWDGRPLEGKSLLMHAEQGLGDTLQFVRYAPLARERGGRIILECQKPLRPLLGSCPGVDQLVARGDELPPFDFHVPLLSLAPLLGATLDNIPADVPYLFARDDLIQHWRSRLGDAGFKVGICWQGSPTYRGDRQRSFPLSHFAALADMPGVRLVSLQKGAGTEQLATAGFPVTVLGDDFDVSNGAFMDTAAVMKSLDLVITSDTAVAHLAGALGVPVWVALPRAPDWRWLLDREDSPWYPTMRLFRQDQAGDWGSVFARIAEALRARLATFGASPPPAAAGLAVGQDSSN